MARHRSEAERRAEVARWRASGQTAAAYCAAHGMSTQALRRWRWEVGDAVSGAPAKFLRLQVAPRSEHSGLTVEVGRARVRLEQGFDAELLRSVVEALSGGART